MNTYTITVNEIKTNKILLKQLKQLSRNTTGEQLKMCNGDLTVLTACNNKIIGMCNIAMASPEKHFAKENEIQIPYLYNYMCTHSEKKKKASVAIMYHIKNVIESGDYEKEINLDILYDNIHAQNFFKKNNFIECGEYTQGSKEYKMFSCCTTGCATEEFA